MKIGILTYHRAYNYGAFLQAYALKSFLAGMGHEVNFIDYWPYDHEKMYSIWDRITTINSFFRGIVVAQKRYGRYKRFRIAQKHYLGITPKPAFRYPTQLTNLEYDVIIYGSDQIWWKSRIGNKGFDSVYWGEYINKSIRKVAYAASMGIIDLTEQDTSEIRNYLKNFSHISVRETQLMSVLQPFTSTNIKTVLDPTLLMTSSFWESLCTQVKPIKGKYIFCYNLMIDPKADAFAQEMGKKLKLPVVRIIGKICSYRDDGINSIIDPISFLALIRNAEYVISSSFHGVALSIQFHKEFYAMGMNNNSGRVSSLLELLGIEKRITDSVPSDFSDRIDYNLVHTRLSALRQESLDFLTTSIQL